MPRPATPYPDGLSVPQGETDAEQHRRMCMLTMMDLSDVAATLARAALVNDVSTRITLLGPAAARLETVVQRIRDQLLKR